MDKIQELHMPPDFPAKAINEAIQQNKQIGYLDTNLISDGYHTFGDLYEHRIQLFIALCSIYKANTYHSGNKKAPVWRSWLHSDGSSFDGWFVLGLFQHEGYQITYHLPASKWRECEFAETLDRAPEFDGHTSADVLKRLKGL